jgi:hypothetical protein
VQVAARPAGEVVPVAPGEAVTLLVGQQDVRDVLAPAGDPPSKEALSAVEQLLPRETLYFCNADSI